MDARRPFLKLKNCNFSIFKKWVLFITASTKLKPYEWYCCQQLSYKRGELAQITWCWHFKHLCPPPRWGDLMGTWTAAVFHNPLTRVSISDWQQKAEVWWEYMTQKPAPLLISDDLGHSDMMDDKVRTPLKMLCLSHFIPPTYINSQAPLHFNDVNWFLMEGGQF